MIKQKWKEFKSAIISESKEYDFEIGLSAEELKDCKFKNSIPDELLDVLYDSNGQKINSKPMFFEFKNQANGIILWKFNFLNLEQIILTYNFIQEYTKTQIDANLIPFAKYEKGLGDQGTMAFTINKIDKTIHRTLFYEYDRFVTVFEFRSEKIANNLNDFLENQILWRTLKLE
ncbi:hypothetical protein [Flavobacterium limnophilum]|uniref:hypothetical protein n=1 Tax=Flavobacterium limnophilum TaxID=3003262 RepID=UPI0022ABE953|nr:hypothetical protein [Flavobacterium limnophilum]